MRGGRGRCDGRDPSVGTEGIGEGEPFVAAERAVREETPPVEMGGAGRGESVPAWLRGLAGVHGTSGEHCGSTMGAPWEHYGGTVGTLWQQSAASFSQPQPGDKLVVSAQHTEVTATSAGAEPETKR